MTNFYKNCKQIFVTFEKILKKFYTNVSKYWRNFVTANILENMYKCINVKKMFAASRKY